MFGKSTFSSVIRIIHRWIIRSLKLQINYILFSNSEYTDTMQILWKWRNMANAAIRHSSVHVIGRRLEQRDKESLSLLGLEA